MRSEDLQVPFTFPVPFPFHPFFCFCRFFFKSFCPDVNMELYEELSDDMALLPLVDGKIVGRVEKLPVD